MSKKSYLRSNIYGITIVWVLVSVEIFFRVKGIPIPIDDATAYYVPGIVFSETNSLVHPFWAPEGGNAGPFLWHGWIHSYITGLLGGMFWDGFTGVRISETLIVAVGCTLFSNIISELQKNSSSILHIFAVLSTTIVSFSMFGRPESAAFTVLIAGVFVIQRFRQSSLRTGSIVLLWGLLGATQPTVALLVGPVLLGYLVLEKNSPLSALAEWIAIGGASVLVTFLLTSIVYPYSITEWINGLLIHAEKIATRSDFSGILHYYFLSADRFMQGLIFVFSIPVLFFIGRNIDKTKRVLFVATALIGVAITWYTAVRIPATRYNLFALYPLFMIIIAYGFVLFEGKYKKAITLSSILLIGVFSLLIVGRRYFVFGKSLGGASKKDVRRVVESLPDGSSISIDASLLIASYSSHKWHRFNTTRRSQLSRKSDYLILKQADSAELEPPSIDGFSLIKETFNKDPIFLGPIKLANTYDSYNFAVYKNIK